MKYIIRMIAAFENLKFILRFCIDEKMFKTEKTVNAIRERVVKLEEGIGKWRKFINGNRQDPDLHGQVRTTLVWKEGTLSFTVIYCSTLKEQVVPPRTAGLLRVTTPITRGTRTTTGFRTTTTSTTVLGLLRFRNSYWCYGKVGRFIYSLFPCKS